MIIGLLRGNTSKALARQRRSSEDRFSELPESSRKDDRSRRYSQGRNDEYLRLRPAHGPGPHDSAGRHGARTLELGTERPMNLPANLGWTRESASLCGSSIPASRCSMSSLRFKAESRHASSVSCRPSPVSNDDADRTCRYIRIDWSTLGEMITRSEERSLVMRQSNGTDRRL